MRNLGKCKTFPTGQNKSMTLTTFYGSKCALLSGGALESLAVIKTAVTSPHTKLIVVSDFDHTLTNFTSLQCHDVIGYNSQYPQEFLNDFKTIFDTPMSCLAEWWRIAHDLIVNKSGLTEEMFKERMDEGVVSVRSGLKEFALDLRNCEIPLVIVSAGIRDVIAHTLTSYNIPVTADHLFHIDANYLQFHECGKIACILPEQPVHSESKMLVSSRAPHMFTFDQGAITAPIVTGCSNADVSESGVEDCLSNNSADESTGPVTAATDDVVAIILGDRPGDFNVLNSFPNVRTFRVGFARQLLDNDVDLLLQVGKCDVVFIGEDHGLEAVHSMVEDLIKCRHGRD